MVMPSLSSVAPWRPHIGSGAGGGTFFAAIPDSQCPALPAQQGIVSVLAVALASGSSGAINDKATNRQSRHMIILKHRVCLLCCFETINLLLCLVRQRFPDQFHFALRTDA
jgi:hypothetical protein